MHCKQYALAASLAGLVMWLLAGVWHALLMAAFYRNETEASHDGVGTILIAYFILGGLMTYLYPHGTKRNRPVRDGLVFGIVTGLLWVFPHELAMAGAHGESLAYVFKNAAWHMVEQGAGGMVIGWVSGKQRDAHHSAGMVGLLRCPERSRANSGVQPSFARSSPSSTRQETPSPETAEVHPATIVTTW